MLKEFPNLLGKLPKLSSSKTRKKNYELSVDYIVSKIYEYGHKVSYNKINNTYNSCCPICREGNSWGRKKRCYYIPEKDNIYCHNCGSSLKPFNWIREVSGMSDDQIFEDFDKNDYCVEIEIDEEDAIPKEVSSLPEDCINLFDPIQIQYYSKDKIVKDALDYIRERKLDVAINRPDGLFLSKKDYVHKNRLIIPFKDSDGQVVFYQSRKLKNDDDSPRYLSKFNSDRSIFGIERIRPDKDEVFIFEGPLDACFCINGIALCGINQGNKNFTKTQMAQLDELRLFRKIWVLDNQWVDKTAREKTIKLLEEGECLFIWPKELKDYKDFNDLCISKNLTGVSSKFIKENSFCGKEGVLKFKIFFSKIN